MRYKLARIRRRFCGLYMYSDPLLRLKIFSVRFDTQIDKIVVSAYDISYRREVLAIICRLH